MSGHESKDYLKLRPIIIQTGISTCGGTDQKFELNTKQRINKMSKGMLSMVTIIVALASKADFTFMDEPVAGLDAVMRDIFTITDGGIYRDRTYLRYFHTYYRGSNRPDGRSGHDQKWRGAAERNKNLENDWLIGDESWREGNKNTFEIRLIYYADADDAKEGRESEYQYKIHFDDVDGYVIKSEGVPEKEIVFPENK